MNHPQPNTRGRVAYAIAALGLCSLPKETRESDAPRIPVAAATLPPPAVTPEDVLRAMETRPRQLVIRCASARCGVLCAESGAGVDGARAAAARHGFRSAPGQPAELLFCFKCARKLGYKPPG